MEIVEEVVEGEALINTFNTPYDNGDGLWNVRKHLHPNPPPEKKKKLILHRLARPVGTARNIRAFFLNTVHLLHAQASIIMLMQATTKSKGRAFLPNSCRSWRRVFPTSLTPHVFPLDAGCQSNRSPPRAASSGLLSPTRRSGGLCTSASPVSSR